MLKSAELRIGNRLFWKPSFANTNLLVQIEIVSISDSKLGYIRSHLEHRVEPFEDNLITTEIPYASYQEFEPIPITDNWLQNVDKTIKYPSWIFFVHELQNWYYWQHNKVELEID